MKNMKLSLLALSALAVPALMACARVRNMPPKQAVDLPMAPVTISASYVGPGSLSVEGEGGKNTKLAIERVAAVAKTSGDSTEMSVEHVFRNDSETQLEGTFRFPMPEGALLTGLAMEIDGKMMEGELTERDKARKAYEQVVDAMLDPALLEWENGRTFKLRVFPIEPKKTKRVVIRFVAPLHRTNDGLFFAYRAPSGDLGVPAEKSTIHVDGKQMAGERVSTGETLFKIANAAPIVVAEKTKEGTYYVAHIRPTFAEGTRTVDKPQALIVMCDRSRSMLEGRGLQTQTVSMLLSELGVKDKFAVITGDVRAKSLPGGNGGLHAPIDADKKAAVAFVDAEEPDGASDMMKLVNAAAEMGKAARTQGLEPVYAYLGDASPTWGETRAAEIEKLAKAALGDSALHAMVLGKSPDDSLARTISGAMHGRLSHPKTETDARAAAFAVVHAREARRIDDAKIVGLDGADAPTELPITLYEGADVSLALFVPATANASELTLQGTSGGKAISQKLVLTEAKPASDVAKRWAKAKIDRLESEGEKNKDLVIKTSLDHGVMSRYTSFLVLESEEQYARFNIARKAKAASGEATVSGQDLDGSGRSPSVTPDHLQPGDPEVRIPAPADAQSVVVVFPFGETKNATFELDSHGGTWIARFLVDRATPDGTYDIVVRVTHKDGRVQIITIPYVVDTLTPNLDVKIVAKNGGYEIRAKQVLTEAEIAAQAPSSTGTIGEKRVRYAHILTDAKRVEVATPDGQVLSLIHVKLGEFVGTWKPIGKVAEKSSLRVVAVDRALNESVMNVELP